MLHFIQDLLLGVILISCVIVKLRNTNALTPKKTFLETHANIMFLLILILSTLTLSYKLNQIPAGLHVDEAGALYDAICISQYGVDRYLYQFPVYFINFGGGQNALYTYLAAIFIKLFGQSIFIFRLPSVVLSLISLLTLYKMIAKHHSKTEAIFTCFLLAITPWFILKSRWGLESYLMCSLITISTFVLLKAFQCHKNLLYLLAGLLFGLTLYTYAIAYIVVPFMLAIVLLYNLLTKKIHLKNVICMSIPLGLLALPLLMMLLYNNGTIKTANLPLFSIPKLWFYRGGEISLTNIPENLKNICDILFIKDFLNYNAIPTFGTLYPFSIPLVLFGLIEVIKNTIQNIRQKEFSLDFMMLVTFLVVLGTGLCVKELNINKINSIYIPMIYFAGRFLNVISKNTKFLIGVIIGLYSIYFVIFMHSYFTNFANTKLLYFEKEIITASQKAEELQKPKIYVENALNQTYIYTLIATPLSPYDFQQNLQIENGSVISYGKYHFQIPEEIEENAVYILKNDISKIQQLIEYGFKIQTYGEFHVLSL